MLVWGIGFGPIIIVALIMIFIMRSVNKNGGTLGAKQKVFNIIASSQVYSVSEISKLSGISEERLIPILQYIISHSNTDWEGTGQYSLLGDTEFLRGSRLDLSKMEIILAENKSAEFVKPKWACPYCLSKNPGEEFACGGCGARRQS